MHRAAAAHDEEAAGHGELVGGEVLATHARRDLDESVRVDDATTSALTSASFITGA